MSDQKEHAAEGELSVAGMAAAAMTWETPIRLRVAQGCIRSQTTLAALGRAHQGEAEIVSAFFPAGDYWPAALSEPMPARALASLIGLHSFRPTDAHLYKQVADGLAALGFNDADTINAPLDAVARLANMPLRKHLIPGSLALYLNFEPSARQDQKPKGGRPDVADWDVVEELFRERTKELGFPSKSDGQPGWRTINDVAVWIADVLEERSEEAGESTIRRHASDIVNRHRPRGEN